MKGIFFVLILVMAISCQQEEMNNGTRVELDGPNLTITKDKILRFENRQSLETFMKSKLNGKRKTRGDELDERQDEYDDEIFTVPADFETISKLKQKISLEDVDDDLEMSMDELNVVKSESLLVDPLLTELMDTTLRVQVGDAIYKINEYGTFAATSMDKIENAISHFDPSFITEDAPLMVELGNGVRFINTFGGEEDGISGEYVDSVVDDGVKCFATRSGENTSNLQLHKTYNVTSYRWSNNSVFEKFLDILRRGKSVTKHNNFSKSRRMMFKVFQCNYGFYASTGVKVEMQKRRRFAFVHYWAYTHAPKLAIGFNYVYGHAKLKKLQPYKGLQPEIYNWSPYNFTINNLSSRYLVGVYRNLEFPRGWADWIYCSLPEIRFLGQNVVNRNELNKIFESGFEAGAKAAANMIGKSIGMNKIGQRDPMVAYSIWGPNDYEFKEQNPFLTGVKEYTGMASKTIYFSQTWGVVVGASFSSNGHMGAIDISGNTDIQFKIDRIDAFGAAYYDGQWKGIRMYN